MGKFDPLAKYLSHNGSTTIKLRFSEIEKILGEELYPSARKYHSYWHLSKTHMLPQAVDEAGYYVDTVQLAEEIVILRKKDC